jgi:Domain of unknown function (DUF4384)
VSVRGLAACIALLPLALAACGVIGTARELTDAQQVIADMKIGPSDLAIVGSVRNADRAYDAGDKITLSARVNKDAYVAILRVRRSGATTVVFPNKAHPKALVKANTTLVIPSPGDPYAIVASKKGPELFEFVASTSGDSWLFARKPAGDASFADLGATTHLLAKDIANSLQGKKGAKTMTASQSLIVAID